jgi:hypothetical protein
MLSNGWSLQRNLRIDKDQKKQLLAARRQFFIMWGTLLQERKTIEAAMKARLC